MLRRKKSETRVLFTPPTPASVSGDSCRLIVESIHREGNLKPTAHACMPSLERVASRAAPSLTVRVASVLYVHVCVLMRTCAAANDRQTEWQRGDSAKKKKEKKTRSELRFRMWLKLRLGLCVQASAEVHDRCLVEIKLVLSNQSALGWTHASIGACTPEGAQSQSDGREKFPPGQSGSGRQERSGAVRRGCKVSVSPRLPPIFIYFLNYSNNKNTKSEFIIHPFRQARHSLTNQLEGSTPRKLASASTAQHLS